MATIEEQLATWQGRVDNWRTSPGFAETKSTAAAREACRPDLLAWLARLTNGTWPLEEARVEFDQRTRTEWSDWGLKGASGAMFLNMLGRDRKHQCHRRVIQPCHSAWNRARLAS